MPVRVLCQRLLGKGVFNVGNESCNRLRGEFVPLHFGRR